MNKIKEIEVKSNYENHKGRFVSIRTVTSHDGPRNFCAKILKETPCYLSIFDVNSKKSFKISKKTIVQ